MRQFQDSSDPLSALAGVLRHRPKHPALRPQRQALARRVKATKEGAALDTGLPQVRITDATSHPLGIGVFDKNHAERVITLIPACTPLPRERRGRFPSASDHMTAPRVGAACNPHLTDYNICPIVSDHWYQVKIVCDSSKVGGIPGSIYVDDQGLAADHAGEA